MIRINELSDIDFKNKIALVRVDFNVPLDKNQNITDTTRIDLGINTIKYIIQNGGKCIIMSHLGRPKGKGYEKEYSLDNIKDYISYVLKFEVDIIKDYYTINFSINNYLNKYKVVLLENLRFYSEEKENNPEFSKKLASFADIYVNNAFGTCHRSHASTNSIINFMKINCVGDLVKNEIVNIEKALYEKVKPFTAILGGAKVSDKIKVIEKLIGLVDNLIIGGAMANTFIKSMGGKIGNSLYENDNIEVAKNLLFKAKKNNVSVYLPSDFICSKSIDDHNVKLFNSSNIKNDYSAFDIGTDSLKLFKKIILNSKKIIWNGPMGVFEKEIFSNGTTKVCEYVARATKSGSYSLIGGGDSVSAVKKNKKEKDVSFISTGGGALLEYISYGSLPSLKLLEK